ncbi:MAG: hypothetical protein KBT39_08435 [Bacteroidales bacterium]|nr:hypothetical protein [Bacteroidales bacterium]
MKHYTLIIAMAFALAACGGKAEGGFDDTDSSNIVSQSVDLNSDNDSASVSDVASLPTTPIAGMESCDMPSYAVKAWIEDGKTYWNVYDKKKYMTVTDLAEEFYRCGDGPFQIVGMDETPIGVFIAKLDSRGSLGLYIIGHKHNLYALDIALEVSGVGGGVGRIPNIHDVASLRQEGKAVLAVDNNGNSSVVKFYSDEGPYEFEICDGEQCYDFQLSSTWNMRLVLNNENYSGHFQSEGNGTFSFTLDRHYRYNEDYQEVDVVGPAIEGTFRVNNNNETIVFCNGLMGLASEKAYSYEVFPLFQ